MGVFSFAIAVTALNGNSAVVIIKNIGNVFMSACGARLLQPQLLVHAVTAGAAAVASGVVLQWVLHYG